MVDFLKKPALYKVGRLFEKTSTLFEKCSYLLKPRNNFQNWLDQTKAHYLVIISENFELFNEESEEERSSSNFSMKINSFLEFIKNQATKTRKVLHSRVIVVVVGIEGLNKSQNMYFILQTCFIFQKIALFYCFIQLYIKHVALSCF